MSICPKIEYVLFDLDGLLIDSEKTWTVITNEILSQYGKELTWEIKSGLMGKPDIQSAEHLLSFFQDVPLTIESYLAKRIPLQNSLWPSIPLLPGARKLVLHLKAHNIPIAVATGSKRVNFERKTGHLSEVFDCFEGKVVCADDHQYQMRGKPNPDIFLTAAREVLGRDVGQVDGYSTSQEDQRARGLVFEDSISGMQAGKRAGMSVIWVPDSELLGVQYSGKEMADQKITSIENFIPEEWGLPPYDS